MLPIINTKPRATQPMNEVGIDRSNPIAHKMLFGINNAYDKFGSVEEATRYGVVPVASGTNNVNGQNFDTSIIEFPTSGGLSLFVSGVVKASGAGDASPLKYRLNYNINNIYFGFALVYTGGTPGIVATLSYSDFTSTYAPGPDFFTYTLCPELTVGSRYSVALTVEDNTVGGLKVYVNGVLKTSGNTVATTYMKDSASGRWHVNDWIGSYPALCSFAWSRTLRPNEVMSLHNNPWQLFRPEV